jgi:hypothetical protein
MHTRHTHRHRGRKAAIALLVGIVSLLGTLGLRAAPADAAVSRTGSLGIYWYSPGYYSFRMTGLIPMSRYDAQGYLNNGAMLYISLKGDDSWYDDTRLGPLVIAQTGETNWGPALYASDRGIEIGWFEIVGAGVLNEDIGGDELYVYAMVIDGDGHVIRELETNRVYGSY